jgi:hypothetical protein
MPRPPKAAIHQLCEQLEVEDHFLIACLEESIIEVHETEGQLVLTNGTILRLRRLQRICLTFEVDIPVALMLSKISQ